MLQFPYKLIHQPHSSNCWIFLISIYIKRANIEYIYIINVPASNPAAEMRWTPMRDLGVLYGNRINKTLAMQTKIAQNEK